MHGRTHETDDDAKDRRNCPSCDKFAVIRVLDIPACQACGWAGAVPVDENWKPLRA